MNNNSKPSLEGKTISLFNKKKNNLRLITKKKYRDSFYILFHKIHEKKNHLGGPNIKIHISCENWRNAYLSKLRLGIFLFFESFTGSSNSSVGFLFSIMFSLFNCRNSIFSN